MYCLFVHIGVYVYRLSLHIYAPLLFQVELEKAAGSRWTCFGVRVLRTLDYPTVN